MANEMTILGGKIDITPLLKAQAAFNKALTETKSELERDGAIQRFEFTYELLWKTLKKILAFKGLDINNPRDVFRAAAKEDLISDITFWFEVLKKRNLTTHTYSEQYAVEVFEFLPQIQDPLAEIIEKIKKL